VWTFILSDATFKLSPTQVGAAQLSSWLHACLPAPTCTAFRLLRRRLPFLQHVAASPQQGSICVMVRIVACSATNAPCTWQLACSS
jgi:hypothetical protein